MIHIVGTKVESIWIRFGLSNYGSRFLVNVGWAVELNECLEPSINIGICLLESLLEPSPLLRAMISLSSSATSIRWLHVPR